MERCIEFKPLEPRLNGGLHGLFEECFGHSLDRAWWEWKYEKSPYKNGLNLVALVDGQLAGHYGAYQVKCKKGGSGQYWVNQIGDVMISPNFRGCGVGRSSLISRLTHEFYKVFCGGVAFNYGCPSERHARLGKALLDYKVLEPIWIWELDFKGWDLPLRHKARCSIARSLHLLEVGKMSLSSECAKLYQQVSPQFGLSIVKDTGYLKWRYEKRPGASYDTWGVKRAGRLRLWCVTKMVGNVLEVGDLFFSLEEPALLVCLLHYLRSFYPDKTIRLWANPHIVPFTKILKTIGFRPYPHPERVYLTITLFDTKAFSESFVRDSFYYQAGDFDLF